MSRLIFLIFLCLSTFFPAATFADFAFGLHTDENNTSALQEIERNNGFKSEIVGYIYDTFSDRDRDHLKRSIATLGRDRVYHVTISPMGLSARQVADGRYDAEYRRFFELVKSSGSRFIFRTMHEMNGIWYSWSGDPESFRRAWHRIYRMSREVGLTREQILLDFSVNSEDLPSVDGSVGGTLMACSPRIRAEKGCLAFEDYFPGKNVVDIMGMSLYNWGRGRSESWAIWKSFSTILDNPTTQMYARLKSIQKPIFLGEVATTAVDFDGVWGMDRVRAEYIDDYGRKNAWIGEFRQRMSREKNIVGALYFNRDRTTGFAETFEGELDWAAVSTHTGKRYLSILDFFYDTRNSLTPLPFGAEPTPMKKKFQKKKISSK